MAIFSLPVVTLLAVLYILYLYLFEQVDADFYRFELLIIRAECARLVSKQQSTSITSSLAREIMECAFGRLHHSNPVCYWYSCIKAWRKCTHLGRCSEQHHIGSEHCSSFTSIERRRSTRFDPNREFRSFVIFLSLLLITQLSSWSKQEQCSTRQELKMQPFVRSSLVVNKRKFSLFSDISICPVISMFSSMCFFR